MPFISICFYLQKVDYNIREWLSMNTLRAVFPLKYATNMITAWMMWIPLEVMIYLLPLPIQFPIMCLFCVIFSLILIFSNKGTDSNDTKYGNNEERIAILKEENMEVMYTFFSFTKCNIYVQIIYM